MTKSNTKRPSISGTIGSDPKSLTVLDARKK